MRSSWLLAPPLALLLGCATPQPRCSEYRQVIAAAHAEIAAMDRLRLSGGQSEVPAVDVSEEAALLSKRLKTLCELLWDEKISYDRYSYGVQRAYEDYERTRRRPVPR